MRHRARQIAASPRPSRRQRQTARRCPRRGKDPCGHIRPAPAGKDATPRDGADAAHVGHAVVQVNGNDRAGPRRTRARDSRAGPPRISRAPGTRAPVPGACPKNRRSRFRPHRNPILLYPLDPLHPGKTSALVFSIPDEHQFRGSELSWTVTVKFFTSLLFLSLFPSFLSLCLCAFVVKAFCFLLLISVFVVSPRPCGSFPAQAGLRRVGTPRARHPAVGGRRPSPCR